MPLDYQKGSLHCRPMYKYIFSITYTCNARISPPPPRPALPYSLGPGGDARAAAGCVAGRYFNGRQEEAGGNAL